MHNDDDMMRRDDQPATKGDIDRIELRFASKDDLLRFASKEDLLKFATKDDLLRFATKEDLLRFATKDDLNLVRRELAIEILRTQADVREIKEVMATRMATKSDIQRILDSIDAFAGKCMNYDRATTLHGQALTEVQVKLKDHDQRIATLETRPPS